VVPRGILGASPERGDHDEALAISSFFLIIRIEITYPLAIIVYL
jgi:hypothetical protein